MNRIRCRIHRGCHEIGGNGVEAAELVAFDVLAPALLSRGGITDRAKQLYKKDAFCEKITAVFSGEASGCLRIRSLSQGRTWPVCLLAMPVCISPNVTSVSSA